MADDLDIQQHISDLIGQEHELREQLSRHEVNPADERERLRRLEVELDQCWDLLRQRRAKREFGANPDDAQVRPEGVVEGYSA